jgi:hypothetical protein
VSCRSSTLCICCKPTSSRECKDLSTPALNSLEAELGAQIGLTAFVANLNEVHTTAVAAMSHESDSRRDLQAHLLQLNLKYQLAVDKLDKKRKFLDELPTRVSLVKSATNDLSNQFQAFLSASSAVPGSAAINIVPSTSVLPAPPAAGSELLLVVQPPVSLIGPPPPQPISDRKDEVEDGEISS